MKAKSGIVVKRVICHDMRNISVNASTPRTIRSVTQMMHSLKSVLMVIRSFVK